MMILGCCFSKSSNEIAVCESKNEIGVACSNISSSASRTLNEMIFEVPCCCGRCRLDEELGEYVKGRSPAEAAKMFRWLNVVGLKSSLRRSDRMLKAPLSPPLASTLADEGFSCGCCGCCCCDSGLGAANPKIGGGAANFLSIFLRLTTTFPLPGEDSC